MIIFPDLIGNETRICDAEAFIDAVTVYKICVNISEENALKELPVLFICHSSKLQNLPLLPLAIINWHTKFIENSSPRIKE